MFEHRLKFQELNWLHHQAQNCSTSSWWFQIKFVTVAADHRLLIIREIFSLTAELSDMRHVLHLSNWFRIVQKYRERTLCVIQHQTSSIHLHLPQPRDTNASVKWLEVPDIVSFLHSVRISFVPDEASNVKQKLKRSACGCSHIRRTLLLLYSHAYREWLFPKRAAQDRKSLLPQNVSRHRTYYQTIDAIQYLQHSIQNITYSDHPQPTVHSFIVPWLWFCREVGQDITIRLTHFWPGLAKQFVGALHLLVRLYTSAVTGLEVSVLIIKPRIFLKHIHFQAAVWPRRGTLHVDTLDAWNNSSFFTFVLHEDLNNFFCVGSIASSDGFRSRVIVRRG